MQNPQQETQVNRQHRPNLYPTFHPSHRHQPYFDAHHPHHPHQQHLQHHPQEMYFMQNFPLAYIPYPNNISHSSSSTSATTSISTNNHTNINTTSINNINNKNNFTLPEIFPFSIDFGELSRTELDSFMRQSKPLSPYISWYTAWNGLWTGKRKHLLIIGETPNIPSIPRSKSSVNAIFCVPSRPIIDHVVDDDLDSLSVQISDTASLSESVATSTMAVAASTSSTTFQSSVTSSEDKKAGNSWASLFKRQNLSNTDDISTSNLSSTSLENFHVETSNLKQANGSFSPSQKSYRSSCTLGDIVFSYKVNYNPSLFIPRGLVNRGNMCFMNSILQSLLHCSPFNNLLHLISSTVPHTFQSSTPLIDAMIMFIKEFVSDDGMTEEERNSSPFSEPLLPDYLHESFDSRFRKGRQEDAEEFLGFLLDAIHEEFIKNSSELGKKSEDESGEWVEVGHKNKGVITRNVEIKESPITQIFGGQLRSILKCPGQKDSVTIEPFHSLQLDISHDDVDTVESALKGIARPEIIDGYGSDNAEAQKQILIEKLPPVLILHLKRFVFQNGQTQKLQKHLEYTIDLEIPSDILSANAKFSSLQTYKLFSVVYHHGKSATDGHYTCDVRRGNDEWLNLDDTLLTSISEHELVDKPRDKSAYILFYMLSKEPSNKS